MLDDKRLGKQRVEVLQLMNTLTGRRSGWRNHPAAKMWRGHEDMLVLYGLIITREWKRRGFNDTCFEKIGAFLGEVLSLSEPTLRSLDEQSSLLGTLPELDSMAVVNLIAALEETFGITVEDDEIGASTFATLGSLAGFVRAKMA